MSRRKRESRPPSPDEDEEDFEAGDGGGESDSAARRREAEILATRRAEGTARKTAARAAIESAAETARSAAGSETGGRQVDFLLAGEKAFGQTAHFGLRDKEGKLRSVFEVLKVPAEKVAQIFFVYGESARVDFKKEEGRETVTVTVPLSLEQGELPFLIRQVVWAVGTLDTHMTQKEIGGGGKKKKKRTISVEEPTVRSKLLREALEKEKKLRDGWVEVERDFAEGVPFRKIREKYKKLETGYSAAWRVAEGILDRMMEDEEKKIKEVTGGSIYEDYGSRIAFQEEQLRRTMERQNHLVYPYDARRENLLLLGRPGARHEKIQYVTFADLFGPYWFSKAVEGRDWDIPVVDRFKPLVRDSTMVTDYLLRRKLRGFGSSEGAGSLGERMAHSGVDLSKTFGLAAVELVAGAAVVGLALTVELPLRAISGGLNWLDQTLYNWQKSLGGKVLKNFKPWGKPISEKEAEEKKKFDQLVQKALGRQQEK
jgi:hypothetical protein